MIGAKCVSVDKVYGDEAKITGHIDPGMATGPKYCKTKISKITRKSDIAIHVCTLQCMMQ